MGQSGTKINLDHRLARKIDYIRLLLNEDPSLKEYRDEYRMICEDVEQTLQRYKNKCSRNLYDLILEEKNKMLSTAKVKQDNLHKMKLTDVEAYKLKFNRKGKKLIDICEKMVLSSFETDKKMELHDINYPIFNLTNNELVYYTNLQFLKVKPSHITEDTIKDISYTIAINYNIVPYHNFTHGFSVAQFFYYMWYTSDNVKNYFIGDELFFLLSACIGHDLKHPGKNNGYMTARRNMNALVSFDTSVLESMHAATLLKIIYKYNNCNILKGYNDEDRKKYQSLMVKGIIATDMAFHHKMIEDFKNCKFDKDNITDKDKEFLMGFLLHASDLNNSAQNYENYMVWAKLISMEFEDQTVSEKNSGVPITQMFVYKNELAFYKGQSFFVGVLVMPQFKEICNVFPEQEQMENLGKNVEKLNKMIKQQSPPE